jgi:anaerobic dimethyl sulfoxide reductase subunit B (iron-sulfur subunit)
MTQYAFYIDTSACSGCKACQVACKDHHHLPLGVNWRRVVEVYGGGWTQAGAAWLSSVYAYNLSLSCNHCEKPVCMEVCPSKAISKRPDGIVLIDGNKCLGCRYCAWACPYGAPQYDEAQGKMTKCDFCVERIEQGLPPTCVAACPLRAIEYGELSELEARHGTLAQVVPLPENGLTEPALLLTAHKAAVQAEEG